MQIVRRWKYPLLVIVLVSVGLLGWKAWAGRTPKLDASGEKIRTFVASDKFKELPPDAQKQYADAMFKNGPILLKDGQPTPETQAAMHNAAATHRQAMLDEYFQLPEGKDRKDYLDKQINQQEMIKKLMENPPATQPGDAPRVMIRKAGGSGAAAQKAMAESVPPDQQAKMAQFVHDLQARRAERGLPPGPNGIMMIRINNNGPK
jgi:hypothetical protein